MDSRSYLCLSLLNIHSIYSNTVSLLLFDCSNDVCLNVRCKGFLAFSHVYTQSTGLFNIIKYSRVTYAEMYMCSLQQKAVVNVKMPNWCYENACF